MVKLELILTEAELEKLAECVSDWCDKGTRAEGWQSEMMEALASKVIAAIHKEQQKEKQK